MANVALSSVGGAGAQFFDNNGAPLTGGKIATYAAGTTTPSPTYTTAAGNIAHTNPIILDSAGRVPAGGEIWLIVGQRYKFVMSTSSDVLIASWDNLTSISSVPIVENFNGTSSQTFFNLASAPFSEDSVDIYINGVYQQKNTFSVSNNVISFSEAPPINSTIEVVYS